MTNGRDFLTAGVLAGVTIAAAGAAAPAKADPNAQKALLWEDLNRLGFYDEAEVDTPISWYGAWPTHFAGDPTGANTELGDRSTSGIR